MIWVNSIQELEYYSRNPSDYCYCDLLIQPNDLTIQGNLGVNTAAANLKLSMYTPDGLTWIDDIQIYCDWYIARVSGHSIFNARLRYFPPVMCDNRCFVLRATVTAAGSNKIIFDKWTQQYCLADCCSVPEQVTIEGPGVTVGQPKIPDTVTSPKDSTCRPLLRIRVKFQCIDNWGGDYWGMPSLAGHINGSVPANKMFPFTKVLNITGSKLDQPRDLKRTISINGKVQRSESNAVWEVQSFEEFPVWKFNEISDMLHADFLEINGRQYYFPGGVPFEILYPKRLNKRFFRLKFLVNECVIYQNYGCGDRCDTGSQLRYYVIEEPADTYYTDAGVKIGNFDDTVNWFETSGGGGMVIVAGPGTGGELATVDPPNDAVIDTPWRVVVHDETTMPLAGDFYRIIEVEGENLPAYIYADGTRPSDRIYGQENHGDFDALTGVRPYDPVCASPVAGVVTYATMICNAPITGTVTYIDLCKKPVVGVVVYGDLDEEPGGGATSYILAETGDRIIAENGDTIIQD